MQIVASLNGDQAKQSELVFRAVEAHPECGWAAGVGRRMAAVAANREGAERSRDAPVISVGDWKRIVLEQRAVESAFVNKVRKKTADWHCG